MKKHIFGFLFFLLFVNVSYAVNLNLISVFDHKDGFMNPSGVTSDPDGNVYIADYGKDKIIKIRNDLNTISHVLDIAKPISVAHYQNRLYIVTEAEGGFIFDLNLNSIVGSFGKGYIDNDAFKNIFKPSDLVIDTVNKIVLVVDVFDKYIKPYDTNTGNFVDSIGLIGGPTVAGGDNNGKFFFPTSISFDFTGKLLISDTCNSSAYLQLNSVWNPFKKQYVTNNKYYGNPKGKVQAFVFNGTTYSCSLSDVDARQFLLHGSKKNEGYVLDVSSFVTDENYLYVLDSINKKIFVFDNAATIYHSTKDLNTVPKINYPVAKPNQSDGINTDNDPDDKVGFIKFYGAFNLGVFDNKFIQFKDVVKVGNMLVVTDLMGRVYFLQVN